MTVATLQAQDALRLNIDDLEKEIALDRQVLSNAHAKLERYRGLLASNTLAPDETEPIKEEIASLSALVAFLEKKQIERQRQVARLKTYLQP